MHPLILLPGSIRAMKRNMRKMLPANILPIFSSQVVMAAGEVENVAYQFMMNLGRGVEWDPEEFDAVAAVIPAFKVRK